MKSNSHGTTQNDVPNLVDTDDESDDGKEDGHGKMEMNLIAQDLSPLLEENECEKDKYKTDDGQTAANYGENIQDVSMDAVGDRIIRIINEMSERCEMIAIAHYMIIGHFLFTFPAAITRPPTSPLILSKVPEDTFAAADITFLLGLEDNFHWGF